MPRTTRHGKWFISPAASISKHITPFSFAIVSRIVASLTAFHELYRVHTTPILTSLSASGRVDHVRLVEAIFVFARMTELLAQSRVVIEECFDGLLDLVAFPLVLRFQTVDCRADKRRRLVQEACVLKPLTLYQLSVVVQVDSASAILWRAHDNVTESDVMLRSRRAAPNTNHQADSDVGEAAEHVLDHACGGGLAVLAVRHHCNDNIMAGHLAKGVVVAVVSREMVRSALVLLVKEQTCRNTLGGNSTNPTYSVPLWIWHVRGRVLLGKEYL
jgi:hypothetical protein